MKGDFSRDTFNPYKHFSRVLQQQGRVQLDADTNEQTAILLHYLRTLAADLIGPYARPAGSTGFKINKDKDDFSISAGRYYVDGILCENDKNVTYKTQEDYPLSEEAAKLPNEPYLVYLDVWERHITALEDDYIREKALGGPDTATRTKVIWQVKIEDRPVKNSSEGIIELIKDNIKNQFSSWIEQLWQSNNRGLLKARLKPGGKSTEPCLIAPDAKYRGQENQLYRVEIHQGGAVGVNGNEVTFKWSRDNGAIVTGCTKKGKELILDNSRGFTVPGWVELTSRELELRGESGTLAKVTRIEGNVLTLETDPGLPKEINEKSPLWVRRWESDVIEVRERSDDTDWIDLENGIQIQFQSNNNSSEEEITATPHQYRTGDYWLIPARVVTGDIEWPRGDDEEPRAQPPHGVQHHYAPLAIINKGDNVVDDLHCEFESLRSCEKNA